MHASCRVRAQPSRRLNCQARAGVLRISLATQMPASTPPEKALVLRVLSSVQACLVASVPDVESTLHDRLMEVQEGKGRGGGAEAGDVIVA